MRRIEASEREVAPCQQGHMVWYFAYGSNMSAARLIDIRLAPRGVPVRSRVSGRLDGWRLSFNKVRDGVPAHGAGNIQAEPGRRCTAP
jgi:hypothetical protein